MKAMEGAPRGPDGQPPKPTFILVILPSGGDDVRKSTKQWGDCIVGIPTQCVVRDSIFTLLFFHTNKPCLFLQKAGKYDKERGRDQYCGNVALK